MNDFEMLAPEEKLLARERVISLAQSTQQNALERLRGATAGKQLLSKLLEDRAAERASG